MPMDSKHSPDSIRWVSTVACRRCCPCRRPERATFRRMADNSSTHRCSAIFGPGNDMKVDGPRTSTSSTSKAIRPPPSITACEPSATPCGLETIFTTPPIAVGASTCIVTIAKAKPQRPSPTTRNGMCVGLRRTRNRVSSLKSTGASRSTTSKTTGKPVSQFRFPTTGWQCAPRAIRPTKTSRATDCRPRENEPSL